MINTIKKIKQNFNAENYKVGEKLKDDIKKVSIDLWSNLKGRKEDDYSCLSSVHKFLIDEYKEILQREVCFKNDHYLKNILNLKTSIKSFTDGALSSRIYVFNNEEYDYYFVGDIHSDYFIIERFLQNINFYERVINKEKLRIIFLGDYVDRGKNHLRTLEKILLLKYLFPGNIYHLQGNHDGGKYVDGEVKLCVKKPEEDKEEDYFLLYLQKLSRENKTFDKELIGEYLTLFYSLAAMAIVYKNNTGYLCIHGGIPRPRRQEEKKYNYITSLKDFSSMDILDNMGDTIIHNMLWSDPIRAEEELDEVHRRFNFTEEEFESFISLLGIDYLIRGHEAHESGCELYFNNRLYSVFSSGAVMEKNKNINEETAYEKVSPKIISLKGKDLDVEEIK